MKATKILIALTSLLLFSCNKQDVTDLVKFPGAKASIAGVMSSQKENHQIIVKFTNGKPDHAAIKAVKGFIKEQVLTKAMERANDNGFFVIMVPDVAAAVTALRKNPNVKWAEPDHVVSTDAFSSNDPYFTNNSLWGLNNIKAPTAWNTNTGDQQVFVGLIDEGIMYFHEDLCGQIWDNPYETEDGIDNDGNGYIDDIHGWDFFHNDKTIWDNADQHGTHTAGTIGGKGNNSLGVIGVAPNVTIISGKFLEGSGNTSDAVKAVDYFTDLKTRHGMNIVGTSNSWGGSGYSTALYDAINRSKAADMLFIAAAGNNSGNNNDQNPFYPCSYDLDNIISVAAIANGDFLAGYSNIGPTSVDIAAPGTSVYSTVFGTSSALNAYASYSGTSMATPHVTGAAVLYKAGNPTATYTEVKNAILSSARKIPALVGKCVTEGTLDVSSFTKPTTNSQVARGCVIPPIDLIPPTKPLNIRKTYGFKNDVTLMWDASTDNVGVTGYAVTLDIGWAWAGYNTIGNTINFTLDSGRQWPVWIKAKDAFNNYSPTSDTFRIDMGLDTTKPTTPGNFRLASTTATSCSFLWSASTDNYKINLYTINYRKTGTSYWSQWNCNFLPTTPLEVPGLTTGVQYDFFIVSTDLAGNKSLPSPTINGTPGSAPPDTQAPTIPTGLTVTGKTTNSVFLSWNPSTDNMAVTNYYLYWYETNGSATGLLNVSGTAATVSNLVSGVNYSFYVKASDGTNLSGASSTVNATTNVIVPDSVTGTLSGKIVQKNYHSLSWDLKSNVSTIFIGLQRAPAGTSDFTTLREFTALYGTYQYPVTNGYNYRMKVVTVNNNTFYSNVVTLAAKTGGK